MNLHEGNNFLHHAGAEYDNGDMPRLHPSDVIPPSGRGPELAGSPLRGRNRDRSRHQHKNDAEHPVDTMIPVSTQAQGSFEK